MIIISSVFCRFDIVLEYRVEPVSHSNHCASVAVADSADTLIARDEGELYKETSVMYRGFETTFHIASWSVVNL